VREEQIGGRRREGGREGGRGRRLPLYVALSTDTKSTPLAASTCPHSAGMRSMTSFSGLTRFSAVEGGREGGREGRREGSVRLKLGSREIWVSF